MLFSLAPGRASRQNFHIPTLFYRESWDHKPCVPSIFQAVLRTSGYYLSCGAKGLETQNVTTWITMHSFLKIIFQHIFTVGRKSPALRLSPMTKSFEGLWEIPNFQGSVQGLGLCLVYFWALERLGIFSIPREMLKAKAKILPSVHSSTRALLLVEHGIIRKIPINWMTFLGVEMDWNIWQMYRLLGGFPRDWL